MTVCRQGLYRTVSHALYKAELYIDYYNSRVKLLDYSGDTHKIVDELFEVCSINDLGKIICTVHEADLDTFLSNGFLMEGRIDGYFIGKTAYCLSYFKRHERSESNYTNEEDAIINKSVQYKNKYVHPNKFTFRHRSADRQDAEKLSRLFREVFKTYPTPMDKPEYIEEIINKQVIFKVIEVDNEIVSAASADMNKKLLNAEITDCATYEQYRGRGFLSELIYYLELDLKEMGFITAYSLSRARSAGINIVLSKHGYDYSGRYINNCNIMGRFEDMNIWVKNLRK